MSALDGLDLSGRAGLLGITMREYVSLAESDRRIVAPPALDSDGAVARLGRWLAAGRPVADIKRLEFTGDDDVRALVLEVLRGVPAPVAWHGVEHVAWFEVGRSAGGWMGPARAAPSSPQGDVPHIIALCGGVPDELLRPVIAHELGHSWHRAVVTTTVVMERPPTSRREHLARTIAVANTAGIPRERIIRLRLASEHLADATAELWGYDCKALGHTRAHEQRLMAELDAAAPLVAEIEREIEIDAAGEPILNHPPITIEGTP